MLKLRAVRTVKKNVEDVDVFYASLLLYKLISHAQKENKKTFCLPKFSTLPMGSYFIVVNTEKTQTIYETG